MNASAWQLGVEGTTAIAGHRDSHFDFLHELKSGNEIEIQSISGETKNYVVYTAEIIDSDQEQVNFQYQYSELKLISCYPFDALANDGPLRYVLTALPSPPKDA